MAVGDWSRRTRRGGRRACAASYFLSLSRRFPTPVRCVTSQAPRAARAYRNRRRARSAGAPAVAAASAFTQERVRAPPSRAADPLGSPSIWRRRRRRRARRAARRRPSRRGFGVSGRAMAVGREPAAGSLKARTYSNSRPTTARPRTARPNVDLPLPPGWERRFDPRKQRTYHRPQHADDRGATPRGADPPLPYKLYAHSTNASP